MSYPVPVTGLVFLVVSLILTTIYSLITCKKVDAKVQTVHVGLVVTSHQLSKSMLTFFMMCRSRILVCFLCLIFLNKVKK